MLAIALIFVIPLFLYCSYLFAKDIMSSYSLYKFKKNRLKTGGADLKQWKPVQIQEIQVLEKDIEYTPSASNISGEGVNKPPTMKAVSLNVQQEPKTSTLPEKKEIKHTSLRGKEFPDKNLLRTMSKVIGPLAEMSRHDVEANKLYLSYQKKMAEYVAQLLGTVLVNPDKSTLVYPVEKSGDKLICYLVNESGISEKFLDPASVVECSMLHTDAAASLKVLVGEYVGMKKRINTYLDQLQDEDEDLQQTQRKIVGLYNNSINTPISTRLSAI